MQEILRNQTVQLHFVERLHQGRVYDEFSLSVFIRLRYHDRCVLWNPSANGEIVCKVSA